MYCAGKFRGAKARGGGEAGSKILEKWQDGRLLRHVGGSCGLRARLLRFLDGPKQQRSASTLVDPPWVSNSTAFAYGLKTEPSLIGATLMTHAKFEVMCTRAPKSR